MEFEFSENQSKQKKYAQTRDLPRIIFEIFRNPITLVRTPSLLTWPAAFALQLGGAFISGALTALIEKNIFDFVIAIVIFPVIILMISATFTLFIYYYFSIFSKTYLDMQRLYSLVVIAMFPYFTIHSISGFIPPIDLIGFCLSLILLVVGLVDQFQLGRRPVRTLMSFAGATFFLVWSLVQYLKT